MTTRARTDVDDRRLLRRCLPFTSWFVVLVSGYLYVAGVLCGRSNPFLSGNGLQDFLVVAALSPLFFYLGPRHNWRPTKSSLRAILRWNGLLYLVPFFIALHWQFYGDALGHRFSLKGADLRSLHSRSVVVLAVGLVTIAVLVACHLRWARRAGILRPYVAALIGIPCVIAIITLVLDDSHYLHFHHYCLGALFFPFFRFRKVASLVAQAVFLGTAVEGISRWGMDPMWYPIA